MIIIDYHTHSSNSADSETPMKLQIESAISKGIKHLCITEHMDIDFPAEKYNISFDLNTEKYIEEYKTNKKIYENRIDLSFGVELGLQSHIKPKLENYVNQYSFDFIIGSAHLCDGIDVYYPEFYEGRTEKESYRRYFEYELECLNVFNDFDVFGHLDYIVRYGPSKDRNYKYFDYSDVIDEILCKLISLGKGIEINTSVLTKGMAHPNPCEDILKRYLELGGEIITVGSDAHTPENIAGQFDKAEAILKACGFKHYNYFKERKPIYIDLK